MECFEMIVNSTDAEATYQAIKRQADCVNALAGLNPSALAGLIEEVSETIERLDARGMSSLSLRAALANLRGDA